MFFFFFLVILFLLCQKLVSTTYVIIMEKVISHKSSDKFRVLKLSPPYHNSSLFNLI